MNPYRPESAPANPYAQPSTPPNPYAPPKAAVHPGARSGTSAPSMWNPDAAGAWSLFLTPIFGSILVMLNWRTLGEGSRASSGVGWLIASVLMLFPSLLIPGIGLLWLIVWYFAWQRKQSKYVRERWGKDYPKRGWLTPILIGLGSLFAFGFLFGLIASLGAPAA